MKKLGLKKILELNGPKKYSKLKNNKVLNYLNMKHLQKILLNNIMIFTILLLKKLRI